jgi:hypothetical protein
MKVSLYIGDEVWNKFRRAVLRRTGDPRVLSSEVQGLIEDALVEDALIAGFERMNVSPKPLSSMQVEPARPSSATSAETTLSEMRERRHDEAVSRH